MTLTPQQREAVGHTHNLLLTACPGSGKTRTLIAKLIAEIDKVRDSPRQVCCITYTNTAVQEIEKRAAEQIQPGDERSFAVSTIHAFCLNDIVRPYAWLRKDFRGALQILTRDNPDFEMIADDAAAQVNYTGLANTDYDAFEALGVDSSGQVVGLAAKNDAIKRAAPHFWRRCNEMGYIDFGTILFSAFCLLRDHPQVARSLCAKYASFLIDEFQDTTDLQIDILKLLYATQRSRFFAVGDLAQSIYGFAGARPELVDPFGAHIGARRDLSLTGNFRSSAQIIAHAERLFPRTPAMTAEGPDQACDLEPVLVRGLTAFEAITEHYLPALETLMIPLGEATILAKDWASLVTLSRQLRDFGTPVVGPGARPYKRSRLFASLAEQLCGAVTDPDPDTPRRLGKALFQTLQDATGVSRLDVFTHQGRVILIRLLRAARRLADEPGALLWLDQMSQATGEILLQGDYVDRTQAGMFYASVQEMKADIHKQGVDTANLTVEDLGLFACVFRSHLGSHSGGTWAGIPE